MRAGRAGNRHLCVVDQTASPACSLDGTRAVGDYHLEYVGKSESALRSRVGTHYGGCASHSTLRESLGVLLQDQLGLAMEIARWTTPQRTGKKKPRFGWGATEGRLSEWMTENARVVWLYCEDFKACETSIIDSENLPLNIQGNGQHPFYPTLRRLREEAERKAAEDFFRGGGAVPG